MAILPFAQRAMIPLAGARFATNQGNALTGVHKS
jgi:hypothetical protein